MSKAVMISIRPEWVNKICSGAKTIEVRKTRPKMETPFKCYIYCTRNKHLAFMQNQTGTNLIACMDAESAIPAGGFVGNGKVIGEFTCDSIDKAILGSYGAYTGKIFIEIPDDLGGIRLKQYRWADNELKRTGLSDDLIIKYLRGGRQNKECFFWHISDLKIYDKPKKLSEFTGLRETKFGAEPVTIRHPPQSWFYVEENVSEIQRKVNEPVDALNELRKEEQK